MNIDNLLHNISYCSEVLAYLATVLYFNARKNVVSFILLFLMSMIFVTETLGKFKAYFPSYNNIFVVQNVEMLIEIFLFLLVYYFSLQGAALKKITRAMIVVYACVAIVSSIFWQPLNVVFPTYALVAGGLFILIAIQLYFYEGIKNMQQQSFYKSHLFYISIGLFIFYANEMPVMTLFNYFLEHNADVGKIAFLFKLKLVVSIVFYSFYTFGIIWATKKLPS